MRLAILQPVLIPDLHDLALIKNSDLVVLQDSEPWSRKGRTHRAKLRTPDGWQYINVPVVTDDRDKPIREVKIDHSENWIKPTLNAFEYNYRNSVYYDFYEPEIRADFEKAEDFRLLIEFCLYLRKRIFKYLELENLPEEIFSGEMKLYDSDPDRLAQNLGADIYFQEHDSRHYMRQGKNKSEINFSHPEYRQHFEGFEPYCCLLDLLFQFGPESFRVIEKL